MRVGLLRRLKRHKGALIAHKVTRLYDNKVLWYLDSMLKVGWEAM